jgi:WD40 repeat protein
MADANLALNFAKLEDSVNLELGLIVDGRVRQLRKGLPASAAFIWAVSKDQKQLALVTRPIDQRATCDFEVIDMETGQSRPIEISGVRSCINADWSPDGRRIAFAGTGSDRKLLETILVVDAVEDGRIEEKQIGTLGWSTELQSVTWSPDGQKLAVGGMDGRCEVLDSNTLATLVSSRPSAGAATEVAWHPYDARIASASTDGSVVVWDATTGETLLDFEVGEEVHRLRWSPDGQRLAALLASGEIEIWDASEGYRRSESKVLAEQRSGKEQSVATVKSSSAASLALEGASTGPE